MTDSINLWLVIFHVFETSSVLYYIFFIFYFSLASFVIIRWSVLNLSSKKLSFPCCAIKPAYCDLFGKWYFYF